MRDKISKKRTIRKKKGTKKSRDGKRKLVFRFLIKKNKFIKYA